jgi:hypothetical protein
MKRELARIPVIAAAGAIIAWFVAGAVYYYPAQDAAVRSGQVEDFAAWPVLVIGVAGAMLAVAAAKIVGKRPLPRCLAFVARGSLVGVAAAVGITLVMASMRSFDGWPWNDKRQGELLHRGIVYGSPCGALLGGFGGYVAYLIRKKRRQLTADDCQPGA